MRVLRELVVLVVVLLVAGGLVFGYTQVATAPSRYDTFPGKVNKVPLQISSPVYGQVLTLPLAEGSQVTQGQVLATIQVLDRNFKLPATPLFTLQGDTLSVVSPATGVVAKVDVAALSTVGGNERLVELYTTANTDLWVLLPQGTNLAAYRAFFVWPPANKPTFRIRIEGSIPADVVGGASSTTSVYRARCEITIDCAGLLVAQQVTICAEKSIQRSGLMARVSWLPLGARQAACGTGG
jgi:Biotin-lipoyl like